jgi:integrase/recombinase XerD
MTPIWQRMRDDLQLAGLAARTQEAYLGAARRLADHYHKAPDQITEDQLRQYFLMLRNERKVSRSTMTIALCGIKFLFERTLQRDWPTLTILRPPAEHKLLVVLSIAEVQDLLARIRIPRYRVCLSLIYACGLRLLEGVTLSVPQIDSARMVVHIQGGKGNKDRYVPLPQRALTMLRAHWLTHRHPFWLFPAIDPTSGTVYQASRPMAPDGMQRAFRSAVQEAGLHKHATVHTLRHSWATHLLEAGVSVRMIQVWLGHTSLTTTSRSMHLTSNAEQRASATLDRLLDGLLWPPLPILSGATGQPTAHNTTTNCCRVTRRS